MYACSNKCTAVFLAHDKSKIHNMYNLSFFQFLFEIAWILSVLTARFEYFIGDIHNWLLVIVLSETECAYSLKYSCCAIMNNSIGLHAVVFSWIKSKKSIRFLVAYSWWLWLPSVCWQLCLRHSLIGRKAAWYTGKLEVDVFCVIMFNC